MDPIITALDKFDKEIDKARPMLPSTTGAKCGVCNKEQKYIGEGNMHKGLIWVCSFTCDVTLRRSGFNK